MVTQFGEKTNLLQYPLCCKSCPSHVIPVLHLVLEGFFLPPEPQHLVGVEKPLQGRTDLHGYMGTSKSSSKKLSLHHQCNTSTILRFGGVGQSSGPATTPCVSLSSQSGTSKT